MPDTLIADIMTPDPLTLAPNMTIPEAAKILTKRHISGAPVKDGDILVGVVTESDLIMKEVKLEFPSYVHFIDGYFALPGKVKEFEEQLKKVVGAEVRDVMTEDVVTISAHATTDEAATLFVDKGVSMLPVIEGDQVVGVITKADIVRSLAG